MINWSQRQNYNRSLFNNWAMTAMSKLICSTEPKNYELQEALLGLSRVHAFVTCVCNIQLV